MPFDKDPVETRYSWKTWKLPERPYIHAYHTSLVDKIFLCSKPDPVQAIPVQVHLTFEQTLERIRRIDQVTRGIPKIFYLVGWQFEGHDSKYPSWAEVNRHLMRPSDRNPEASLRWLMKSARMHHSTVSVHINMMDAYENSPLWETYKKAKLIVGKGGIWGGEQAYLIDYHKEWELGLAQQRINNLVTMLPLVDAGTIHIDAFWPTGENSDAQLGVMRKIVRYWRNKGIDVTVEGIVTPNLSHGLIGLSPMVWHLNYDLWKKPDEFTEDDYMEIPASLFCGGKDHSQRGLLFGTSMQGEALAEDQLEQYLAEFCLNTLPWQYLNRFERQTLVQVGRIIQVDHADGLSVRVDLDNRSSRIRQDQFLLRDGNDVFVPASWQKTPEIIAYSQDGYSERWWILPESWQSIKSVQVTKIDIDGKEETQVLPVESGKICLSLKANEAVTIQE